EITPPPNFDLALGQNSQTVQVENQTNATLYPQVRFENNPYGKLKIKKIDAVTGQPLQGAILKISNPLFNYEQEFTTGADGTITIDNLKQGSYEIKEVKAPNGYILSNETKVAILKWGEETTITYENQPKTSLRITKIDSETGDLLDGAGFKLKHTTGGAEYFTEPTEDGIATIDDIVSGTYILIEIQAPNGYILDKTERTIVIENDKINEITIKNSKKPSVKIIKRDIDTKDLLKGAKFEIWRAENNTTQGLVEKVGEYFTDDNGEIVLDNLAYGWYCIKEIQAPKGYLLSEDNTKFVFLKPNQTGANTVEVIFENAKKPNLTINKIGSVGKEPLKGAKFSLFYATTQNGAVKKIGDYITDERGKIEIPTGTLQQGWYKLQETQAPQGYEIQGTGTYEFFLNAGESKEITVENVAKNSIVIKKVDADTGEPLAGAHFSISIISDGNSSGTHGTTIANVITNHNGVAVVTGLKAGGYIIEETKAPTGYVMVEQAQTVWLNKDDTSSVTVTFENRKNAGLGIKKMDSITKEPLA
ncbi:SpaA isopeptide-forming pilin-related protein, partial [uncultured Tyzzerella sp.]|uniref:MSCRAMM family protein n=1 Tax=uncultured Tyzzerella sp. TaxID=2321398 RepID=UPI00294344F2